MNPNHQARLCHLLITRFHLATHQLIYSVVTPRNCALAVIFLEGVSSMEARRLGMTCFRREVCSFSDHPPSTFRSFERTMLLARYLTRRPLAELRSSGFRVANADCNGVVTVVVLSRGAGGVPGKRRKYRGDFKVSEQPHTRLSQACVRSAGSCASWSLSPFPFVSTPLCCFQIGCAALDGRGERSKV